MKFLLMVTMILAGQFAAAKGVCSWPRVNEYYSADFEISAKRKYDFENAILKVQKAYEGEVAQRGAILQINNMWKDGTVNAQAYQEVINGRMYYMVDAFGGMFRYPGMTKDAFTVVLCHELGHHLGMSPLYSGWGEWAATEGQSDYFATLRCMKKLGIPSSAASLALAKSLARMSNHRLPSRLTRDKSRVSRIYESHPDAQCRLDTMDAGRVCLASGVLSPTDPKKGTCHNYDGSDNPIGNGNRPRCWYMP